jgi:D-arabinose 1-dehydrogenase-like Zn-dependent alcohol dehydrogenase
MGKIMVTSDKMKALIAEGWGRFILKEVDIPKIGPKEVLIRVKACGVDRTDVIGWLRTEYVAAGYRTV